MIWRAGRLVPLAADGRADVNHLAAEMLALTHSEARFELALGAADAFARFSMEHCLGQYENLFASLCETSMSGGTRTSC
jgi:hypothetical protein